MARILRTDEKGGTYHVLNHGSYRTWLFAEDGAKLAFEATLFEACERSDWVLHAFCILGNHFHLAVETPRGNLTEGMRWLQSVFANRFHRHVGERGYLFQGSFKRLLVEDTAWLGRLCHYIHLNPVRAGLCAGPKIADYRWSSLSYLADKRQRPAILDFAAALASAGGLTDTPRGRKSYGTYLASLAKDARAQAGLAFAGMSHGWAIGSREFQQAVAVAQPLKSTHRRLTGVEVREARALACEATLQACLQVAQKGPKDIAADAKAADWKVGIAGFFRQRKRGTNGWLSKQLNMGTPVGVSRYVGEMAAGKRPIAHALRQRLAAKVK